MERVAVTLDDDLAGSLSRYARRRQLNRDVAAERLLAEALASWRLDRAIERFAEGEITFERAAAAAEVDEWRFAELLVTAAGLDPSTASSSASMTWASPTAGVPSIPGDDAHRTDRLAFNTDG
ncbi:hypothetical protein [Halorubrum vacuolatum]|uniref:Ribbon-helix-helix protein, copG family n=1 Tax=Halorubrum vacuolatum TaxID=63740 RepID=A0A238WR93_HALVU|nr:hypothetical protein [Halorubrum vacuolatum]SNR49066.1 hypothetical protein SAMN06264855_109108 [Halorubrum vacuolatum]